MDRWTGKRKIEREWEEGRERGNGRGEELSRTVAGRTTRPSQGDFRLDLSKARSE